MHLTVVILTQTLKAAAAAAEVQTNRTM